jgi:hypothetical protein
VQCFIRALARGLCPPPPGRAVGPPGKCDKKSFFWGFAPDFIVGSGGVFRGERSGDRPAVGEKFFLAFVWAGGKNEEKM